MELLLKREVFSQTATLGQLFVNDKFFAFSCEDVIRNVAPPPGCEGKVFGQTAIPYGKYEVALTFSNKFQRYMPLVFPVPCFDGVRIHGGNDQTMTEGCLLIGAEWDGKTRIWNCAQRVNELIAKLREREHLEKSFITITK